MSAPRLGDWLRSGEPGSAFSGSSRGRRGNARGGAGSGTSRGGRGSRGRGAGPNRAASTSIDKPPPELANNGAAAEALKAVNPPKPPPSNTASKPEKSVNTQKSRPPNSRKTSSTRPIPTIVTPSTSTDTATSTSTVKNPSRPPNRRKRSQTNSKADDTIPKIEIPSLDDSHSRFQKGRGGKANLPIPPHSAPPMKDTPPHLSANNNRFDMRNNIDALVERVRAVAMDRPTTPGSHSHIDWAGDDDDSLPDLDDWGVNPSSENTTSVHNSDMISPIMIDGLKSLPDPSKSSPLSATASISPSSFAKEITTLKPSGRVDKTDPSPKINHHREPPKITLPLHPSLPPKPSFSEAPVISHRTGATPMRSPLHSKFQASGRGPSVEEKKTLEKIPRTSESSPNKDEGMTALTSAPTPAPVRNDSVHANETASGESSHKPAPKPIGEKPHQGDSEEITGEKPGLQASIHAPRNSADDVDEARPGLQVSMHAPKARSESSITPPTMVQGIIVDGNRGLTTPNRFHAANRPHVFSRFSRSGNSTPRNGALNSAHTRTHSTPPAGTSPHAYRAPHATRPVITGAAISRLARDIGGVSMSPTRNAVALASKE